MVRRLRARQLLLLLGAGLAVGAPAGAHAEAVTTGELVRLADGPHESWALQTSTGLVAVSGQQDATLAGERVQVRDRDPRRRGLQGSARRVGEDSGARAGAVGTESIRARTLAVVRVVYSAGDSDPAPPATVQEVFRTDSVAVNAQFAAQTGGGLQFTGASDSAIDVFPASGPPLQVTEPSVACSDPRYVIDLTNAVAAQLGSAPLAGYDHVMIVFPARSGCGWAGRGTVPGTWTWINGADSFDSRTPLRSDVLMHELGHNLGARHAGTIRCRDAGGATALSSSCDPPVTYGDFSDAMGIGWGLMSGYHRAETAQLPLAAQQTLADGEVALTDISAPGSAGTRLLFVPRGPAAGAARFAVELRTPNPAFDIWGRSNPFTLPGWDPASPSWATVWVRLVPPSFGTGDTQLLDLRPWTSTFSDAALRPGETFTDPVSGVQIGLQTVSGGVATIRVTSPQPVVEPTPTPTPAPAASAAPSAPALVAGGNSVAPAPGGVTGEPAPAPRAPELLFSPLLSDGRAKLPRSRKLVLRAPAGARTLTLRISGGGTRAKRIVTKRATIRLRLTRRQARRSRLTVTASGGTLPAAVRQRYDIRNRRITRR